MLYNQFDLNFHLELPGSIGEHNADSVEGNQLSWKLSLIETKDVRAESSSINATAIILISVIALVIIGGILFFFMRKKKNQRNNESENQNVNQDSVSIQNQNDDKNSDNIDSKEDNNSKQ